MPPVASQVIDEEEERETGPFVEGRFTASDGIRLAYRIYGAANEAGPPILAVPGLTRNYRSFDPMARRLADEFKVVALSLRGRDPSDWDPDTANYRTSVYVRDLHELWQYLDLGQAVVLGTSLGALLAMLLIEDHPDMLAGVVYNDLGATIEVEGMTRIFGYSSGFPGYPDLDAVVHSMKEKMGGQFPDLSYEEWVTMVRRIYCYRDGEWRYRLDPKLGPALLQNVETPRDLWALHRRAAEMELPILVLRGILSDVLSEETVNRMEAMAPRMQVAEIAGRGHAPVLDEPSSIAALRTFMRGLSR